MLRCRFENQAGFSAEVTLDALARLEADPRVLSIQAVRPLKRFLKDAVPHLRADAYRSLYDGRGVAIAMCDDAFDYYHPKLGGAALGHNAKVLGGYDFGDDDPDPYYDGDARLDHGTKCAGAAAGDLGTSGDYVGGIAPGAKLYLLKIWDCFGNVENDRLILAWNWCNTHKNDDPSHPLLVISVSLGADQFKSVEDDPAMGDVQAVRNLTAAGIAILAASGNEGYCDALAWPACLSNALSVGAACEADVGPAWPCVEADSCVTKYPQPDPSLACFASGWYAKEDATWTDKVKLSSNSAPFLDLLASGGAVYTTEIGGGYGDSFGGTSPACACAAGAAACLQSAALAVNGQYLPPHTRSGISWSPRARACTTPRAVSPRPVSIWPKPSRTCHASRNTKRRACPWRSRTPPRPAPR